MTIDSSAFERDAHSQMFEKRRCIAFTNAEPHTDVQPEEIEFVNGTLELNEGGTALIGVGGSSELEDSFKEFGASVRE